MKCHNPHNPQQPRARGLLHSTILARSPQLCMVLLIIRRSARKTPVITEVARAWSPASTRAFAARPWVSPRRQPVENAVKARYNGRPFRHDKPARDLIVRYASVSGRPRVELETWTD